MGCTSIAFPLLASSNNGYEAGLVFEIAKESIGSFEATNLREVTMVIYGDRIASMFEEQGYNVLEIPENLHKDEVKEAHKARTKQMITDGKEVAMQFLEDQMQKGLDYLKDERNMEKVLTAGFEIAKSAYNTYKSYKKTSKKAH